MERKELEYKLPPWREIQEAQRETIELLQKKFVNYKDAESLVALAIVKPAIVAIIYANAAMNEIKDCSWKDLI